MSKLKALKPAVVQDEEFLDINSNSSDDDDNDKHSKLLDEITKLSSSKKRLRITQRTEPIAKINEHALVQVGSGEKSGSSQKVQVEDLLKSIAEKPRLSALPKALKQAKKRGKTLPAPLEKPVALRVERAAGYEKVKNEVSKWDNVVKGNRVAEQLIFPLNQPSVKMATARDFASKFKPTTPLEQELNAILRGNKYVQGENQELTPAEQEALSAMSLKEALERRKELGRMRVLQSYQEAKARRQNKIKSKKYHRLLKKEKMKNHVKEFETLKERDPEAALEKLEQLERKRVEERMTLKHKGAGKWAKLQAIRAKYDENARESLAEQLRIGKEVTRKVKQSDDESEEETPAIQPMKSDNPWLGGSAPSAASQEITSGYRKLWNGLNESKKIRKEMEKDASGEAADESSESEEEPVEEDEEDEEKEEEPSEEMQTKFSEELDERLDRKRTLEDFSKADTTTATKKRKASKPEKTANVHKDPPAQAQPKTEVAKSSTNIDPNKFVTLNDAVILGSSIPVTEEGGDEEDEEEQAANERRMTLAEAFAEDDVVEQFKEEKKRIIDASAPKDIDLTLPGWGEWGGTGLKVSKRKKKLFIIKAPPAPKRRDDNQGTLILNEDKSQAMRRQKVNDLPFPFRSAAAFESTIRAPVTSTFIPESAARQMAAPKVITKIGTVIEPMSEDVIIKTAKQTKESDEEDEDDGSGEDDKRSGKTKKGKMSGVKRKHGSISKPIGRKPPPALKKKPKKK